MASATTKADLLLKTYRHLASIPALIGGKISENGSIITSVWSQRNLEKGKSSNFIKTFAASNVGDYKTFIELLPIDISTEKLSAISPSQKFRAVVRDIENKEGNKQFLEVWHTSNLIRSIDLTGLDLHRSVYTDGEFGSFQWSPNETKLLYVAEKKVTKKDPINKRPSQKKEGNNEDKADNIKTKAEEYIQDWGEQLVGKKMSILVTYDIMGDEFKILEGIPSDLCVAQPVWSPDATYIVGIAYRTLPRKLGLIYCSNRLSTIFKLELENGNYSEIGLENQSVKCPRFSPDGKSLIWLQRPADGPHYACMALVRTILPILPTSKIETIVDIVQNQQEIVGKKIFYGLYNANFPRRCFASNNRLLLSTNQRNTMNTYIINLDNKEITELEYPDGSLIVLDVCDDNVLVNKRNFLRQDVLAIGKLSADGQIKWVEITESAVVKGLENCMYRYIDLQQENDVDSVRKFTAIYVGPKVESEKEVPLIIWPHGGPHSAFANNLSLEASFFSALGYGIIMVNYRGSIGAGQASVDFILGRCGTSDVSDCILATKQALEQFPWLDDSRIGLVGGSHGGFLVTHLSGQAPDVYHAVVARNPVIDIASMSIVSDIPDWCYVECGSEYSQRGEISNEVLLKMRKSSPIQYAHLVKAPTLLQVGTNDLRVPPSQSIDYYHRLKANNITVNMNIYDDNHPLGQVPNEMDNIVSTALWLEEHLIKK